jgi:predicted nuclease of restriction endonuclease-like RecB superfamily
MTTSRLSKSFLRAACLHKQNILLTDFEQEIQRLTDEITRSKEMSSQEQSGQTESNELLVRLEHELLFAKKEQAILEGLDVEREFVQVELGALVVTDQRIFYISSSLETVEVNGVSFFGISTQAPIYEGMKGKRVGATFSYAGVNYRILEIY